MENPYTRLKTSSIKVHPSGAVSFELETVPYKQAYEEAMVNTWGILEEMYKKHPSSFRFTILNLSDANTK